jgi:hypothetical protein
MHDKKNIALLEEKGQSKRHTTIFISCLIEDIKEIMRRHEIPQEFHVLQLTRVLTEMLITTKS